MSVLLLGINYRPEPVGIGQYTSGMVDALVAAGLRVEVVTAKPYYPAWRVDAAYARTGWHRETLDGARVARCPLYVPREPGGLKRVLHHLSFATAAIGPMVAASRRRPRLVIVVAPSLLSVPLGWMAAKLAGAPLWVHVQDFEVEAAFATGLIGQHGWLKRFALAVENRLLRGAHLVSTISPQMVGKLINKGVARSHVRELRNWADDAFVPSPGGVDQLRAEWKLSDRKVALYSGNIAAKQGIGILIEAARLLVGRDDIVFVICGQGPNRAALEQAARELPNVHLEDLQRAARMGDLLALASVHLLPQLPDAADLVLPSKLTNMLGSARPVIATAVPGTGLYDEVAGCGICTPPGDASALARAVTTLIDDPERRRVLGRAALERARTRWSRSAILAGFIETATALMAAGRNGHSPGVAETEPNRAGA